MVVTLCKAIPVQIFDTADEKGVTLLDETLIEEGEKKSPLCPGCAEKLEEFHNSSLKKYIVGEKLSLLGRRVNL